MAPRIVNTPKTINNNQYQRLHILLSLLAFVLVTGSILVYNMNKIAQEELRYNILSAERDKKLYDVALSLSDKSNIKNIDAKLVEISKSLNKK